jgi:hypothetical protein
MVYLILYNVLLDLTIVILHKDVDDKELYITKNYYYLL